jgi:hypothetical protein
MWSSMDELATIFYFNNYPRIVTYAYVIIMSIWSEKLAI